MVETCREGQDIALQGKERISNADNIVIATNFLYKDYRVLGEGQQRPDTDTDGIRGDLALEMIRNALGCGIRIVACDGGSSLEFISALENFKSEGLTVVKSEVAGRAPQRRRAYETAALLPGSKIIIYTQAEKISLIDHLTEISKPILEGQADVIVLKRNAQLFEETYPDYMIESEFRVNRTYDWLMQ